MMLGRTGKRLDLVQSPYHLDLVAVGLAQPHPLAAAGLVDAFDRRGAGHARNLVEVFLARRVISQADEAGRPELGHMEMMLGIGAAHEELVLGATGANHAEIEQEFFLLVEIGRAQTPPRDVLDLDDRHDVLLKS